MRKDKDFDYHNYSSLIVSKYLDFKPYFERFCFWGRIAEGL